MKDTITSILRSLREAPVFVNGVQLSMTATHSNTDDLITAVEAVYGAESILAVGRVKDSIVIVTKGA